jgi:hypothetical protein
VSFVQIVTGANPLQNSSIHEIAKVLAVGLTRMGAKAQGRHQSGPQIPTRNLLLSPNIEVMNRPHINPTIPDKEKGD